VAYVLPAYSILRRTANRRDDITTSALEVEGTAAVAPAAAREVAGLMGTEWTSGELSLSGKLQVRFPGRCRLELSSPDTTKVLAVASSNGKSRAEGGDLAALKVLLEESCALLALRSQTDGQTRALMERHLDTLKVDQRRTALGRFAGTLVFLIGSKDPNASQFWVYKERFQPARVMFTDAGGTRWDVRFLDFSSQATGNWFPRIVEVYKGEELQLRVMALEGNGAAKLDEVKF
jgi:hypothetical protein